MNSEKEVPVLSNEQFAEKYGCSRAGYKAKYGYSRTQKRNMLKLGINPHTNLQDGLAALKKKRKAEKLKKKKAQREKHSTAVANRKSKTTATKGGKK